MFRVNSTSSARNELFLLQLFFKKFPRSQVLELCPASTVASPQLKETLPSLPVQPLDKMLEKYLKSVKPFLNSSEFETTKKLTEDFCTSASGQKLQSLLEERGKAMDNWLSDWWLQTAYLEYRDPVVIYSSPALVWPMKEFPGINQQLQFAARVITAALQFNQNIEMNTLPQDKLGESPLCMSQYNRIFGTCRIPKIPRDELRFQDPDHPSENIIIMYRKNIFSIPAFADNTRKPYSASHFYSMLSDIVADSEEKSGIPVGILTTEHRDNWAKSYAELKKNNTNKNILEEYVEKALFVVCIDEPVLLKNKSAKYDTRCSNLLLHGYGSQGNAGNRWFDKTVQFVVGADSDGVGVVYEHSPAEGGPIAVLTDFIYSSPVFQANVGKVTDYPKPKRLEFVVSNRIQEDIEAAERAIDRLSRNLEIFGWCFYKFGKNDLKFLKVSPDSFVQIAIQLAFYSLHKHPAAQYESGSLRKFIYGRTDTIRSCSEEVVNFCKMITQEDVNNMEVSKALLQAIDAHKKYAKEVLEGQGVDRHLLALKILAKLNNIEEPNIFSDVGFKRSTYFQLSTSNVPTNVNAFMVYGPLVKDGYACCYNIRNNSINFGMTSWYPCDTTKLSLFQGSLHRALCVMRNCLALSLKTSKL